MTPQEIYDRLKQSVVTLREAEAVHAYWLKRFKDEGLALVTFCGEEPKVMRSRKPGFEGGTCFDPRPLGEFDPFTQTVRPMASSAPQGSE